MRKKITAGLYRVWAFSSLCFLIIFRLLPLSSDILCASTDRTSQDQIEIIESNLSREREKYEVFDLREKDLLHEVSELEQDVAERRITIEKVREKIRIDKIEIKKLKDNQARLEQLLRETEIKAAKRMIALYKYARKGYIKILANVVDMDQFCQRVVYLKAVSEVDRVTLSELAREGLQYRNAITKVENQIDKKKSEETEQTERLTVLREELEEKVIRLMKIHKEKEFYETAVKELQLAAQDLKQTFSKIEEKKEYEATRSSRFEDSKNMLPFPLEGNMIRGDKLLGAKNLNLNKGVFIEGSDTEVKTIFPGRIDFSGRLKGYGEIVIINHGSRFFSISAQLSKRLKKEGDMVEIGDVIGLVEKNGTTNKARLYFEIRKGGKSLDPLSWLKVR